MVDRAFIEARIAKLKTAIAAYDDALIALASPGIESYTIDTGQTRTTVTNLNITEIRKTQTQLQNDLETLQERLSPCGTQQVIPKW